ncbi:leucine-rich repeat-containing protein 43 isoform X1 [Myotis yumanensis]|uniref:leucine-rich repeat-containing protein 43 isoform X1 n=1 Tax=Myotis yumanensis TaxID=159337 RepID=UPI0038D36EDB
MEEDGGTVSAAVREHLRQLCLQEFPCGAGSWNKSRFLPQTWRAWRELVPREEEAGGPAEETVEDLLGLVCSPQSPWALLEGSSAEDLFLRQLAIRNPQMLKEDFLYSYFRSLQVVDKEVSLVDKDLLKFPKLEELVLSANQIKEIDAFNLPPTLKVLELYGNIITSMKCLCAHPPPGLQHLGLGHNKLLGPLQSMYITSQHWPNLVSLDLGFNDLTDLQGMMASLSTLQRLRLLVLQGNPLALVPYYRGFTIDSLARLCVLDDITVSSSEKHQFQGLRYKADVLAREAQFVVTIGNIRGVLDSSVLDPEPGPQGPLITYSYYVTYDFVEDEEGEGSEYGGVLAEIVKPTISENEAPEEAPAALAAPAAPDTPAGPAAPAAPDTPEEAEDSAESAPTSASQSVELESAVSGGSLPLPGSLGSAEELAQLRPRMDLRLCPSPGTVLFSTVRKPWADVIPCNYEMQHTLRDLVPLKAFLLAGTTVTIVEEKVGSPWRPVPLPVHFLSGPAPQFSWFQLLSRKTPAGPSVAHVPSRPPCCPLDSLLARGAASCRQLLACQGKGGEGEREERERGERERGERQERERWERQGRQRGEREGTPGPGQWPWALGTSRPGSVTLPASPPGTEGGQEEERGLQGASPGPPHPAGAGQRPGGPGAPAGGGSTRVHPVHVWGDPHLGIRQADISQGTVGPRHTLPTEIVLGSKACGARSWEGRGGRLGEEAPSPLKKPQRWQGLGRHRTASGVVGQGGRWPLLPRRPCPASVPGEAWQGGAAHKTHWNLHPPLCERLIWWFFSQDSKTKKTKKALEPGKAKNKMPALPGYESDYHPEPLTVEVQIQVNQCRSAEEALRTLVV